MPTTSRAPAAVSPQAGAVSPIITASGPVRRAAGSPGRPSTGRSTGTWLQAIHSSRTHTRRTIAPGAKSGLVGTPGIPSSEYTAGGIEMSAR
jgi:hypothetical protein